ncbi:DUF4743 domain-containing protein [Stella sp.]|uniref:NUDIX hydrolase n=1 Tax=Stella sp. TaxID=2912054 RepID=UPI0035B01141
MGLLRHIEAVNRWDPARFRPLVLGERRVGRIRHDFAPLLAAFPAVFAVETDRVRLRPDPAEPEALTAAVALATRRLVADGAIPNWRGEWFDVVAGDDEQALFRVDRGALPRLGMRAAGVHLNGYVRRPDGIHLWIARRSPDKKLDPDKLDNMVAGGIGAGHGPWSTLLKEGEEEAALPADLLARAHPAGIATYVMEREDGLRDDLLYLYDLEMPEDVVPRPNDGEIADFRLLPATDVLALVRDTDRIKFNVNVTLIDFFVRHGILRPGDPDYVAICRGLRR